MEHERLQTHGLPYGGSRLQDGVLDGSGADCILQSFGSAPWLQSLCKVQQRCHARLEGLDILNKSVAGGALVIAASRVGLVLNDNADSALCDLLVAVKWLYSTAWTGLRFSPDSHHWHTKCLLPELSEALKRAMAWSTRSRIVTARVTKCLQNGARCLPFSVSTVRPVMQPMTLHTQVRTSLNIIFPPLPEAMLPCVAAFCTKPNVQRQEA